MLLANQVVTEVRRRAARDQHGHRGRATDAASAHRRLLLRAGDTLGPKALARLTKTLRTDDPTDEIGAAWAIKELLRQLLAAHGPTSYSRSGTAHLRTRFLTACVDADMPETTRLAATIERWWPESGLRVQEPDQLRKAHHDAQRDPPGRVNHQRSRSTSRKVEEPIRLAGRHQRLRRPNVT